MEEKVKEILQLAMDKISEVKDLKEIENIRVEFLGKNGKLTSILKMMGTIAKEDRPKWVQLLTMQKMKFQKE